MSSKTLKQMVISFAIMAGLLTVISIAPATGLAQGLGVGQADVPSALAGSSGDIRSYINTLINWILGFLGFICVILVIYAGFIIVTSVGDTEKVGNAKNIILYALIGVLVILGSYAIVNTIFSATSGTQAVTN